MEITKSTVLAILCMVVSTYGSCQAQGRSKLRLGGKPFAHIRNFSVSRGKGERAHRIVLTWTSHRTSRQQMITLPKPWYCAESDSSDKYCPDAVRVNLNGAPALMVVASRESGVYDVRTPILFTFSNNRWQRSRSDLNALEFTNFGSCYYSKGKLFVWDYEMASNLGHGELQRYWLKTFRISNGCMTPISTRFTVGRYSSPSDDDGRDRLSSSKIGVSEDPLREFGLRWKWWGDN